MSPSPAARPRPAAPRRAAPAASAGAGPPAPPAAREGDPRSAAVPGPSASRAAVARPARPGGTPVVSGAARGEAASPPSPAAPATVEAFRAEAPAIDFDTGPSTVALHSLAHIRALVVPIEKSAARLGLAEVRGYTRAEQMALAEVGYHYLMSGGTRLALVIFEGLVAIAPDEAYFHLALGLAYDHADRVREADAAWTTAARLAPRDARPDLNRAELAVLARDAGRARQLLTSGLAKARAAGDLDLETRARALLARVDTLRPARSAPGTGVPRKALRPADAA
jgi:hypothetical protein